MLRMCALLRLICLAGLLLSFLCLPRSLEAYHLSFTAMVFMIDTQTGDSADVYINGKRVGVTPYLLTLDDIQKLQYCEVSSAQWQPVDSDASFTAFSESGAEVQTYLVNAELRDSTEQNTFLFRTIEGDDASNCTLLVRVVDRQGNTAPCVRGKLKTEGPELIQTWFFGT